MGLFDFFKRKKWEALGVQVSNDYLYDTLSKYNPRILRIRDGSYQAIPYKDFEYLMAMKRQYEPEYKSGIYDCEDFCVSFLADIKRAWADLSDGNVPLAFGYIEAYNEAGTLHAFIWQLDDQMNINFIEPQRNARMTGTFKKYNTIEA
jgi:hypothetical protein